MTYKISKKLLNVFVPVLIVVAMVTTYKVIADKSPINKAEMAYVEHSPIGARGGSVMPASCDSYPVHSTCECNPNTSAPETYYTPPTPTTCTFANGVGKIVRRCQGGESWTWIKDSCDLVSCSAGFDPVTDYNGTRCEASCTGNQRRTYTTRSVMTACNEWNVPGGGRPRVCIDPEYTDVPFASCSPCTGGTVPNANHTACVTPATPSVNINLGQ